jgi:hypothetical protein
MEYHSTPDTTPDTTPATPDEEQDHTDELIEIYLELDDGE